MSQRLYSRFITSGEENDVVAAGFLIFVVGETLILSGAAMDLAASGPVFAAGTGLWAASLALAFLRLSFPGSHSVWLGVGALQEYRLTNKD